MKKKLLLLFVLSSIQIHAQFWKDRISGNGEVQTEYRNVSDFSRLSVTGAFKVKIVPGGGEKISITADENLFSVIETFVKNDKLYIRIDKNYELTRYTRLDVNVPVSYLRKVALTGSGTVYSEAILHWDEIEMLLVGSGDFDFDLDVQRITAKLTGSGNITLNGKAKKADLFLVGSGDIDAKQVKLQDAQVKITGSGNVYVQVINNLKANIFGSGNLYYYNDPATSKIKVFGSGEAIKR